jgi:flagella basal body P-ring formation protein FlgA
MAQWLFACCLMGLLLLGPKSALAQIVETQQPLLIKQKVADYLRMQSQGAPGRVEVAVGAVDAKMKLEKCAALEASLPVGSRAWGKTTVAVSCTTPSRWTVYVQATVSVFADYVIAAAPLAQGRSLVSTDLALMNGDLASLPAGIFTDANQLIGQVVGSSLPAGSVLRQDMLRSPLAVKQGQTVRLMSVGPGFKVGAPAYALANASVGQIVQAKAANGSVVSGIVRNNGEVEVTF